MRRCGGGADASPVWRASFAVEEEGGVGSVTAAVRFVQVKAVSGVSGPLRTSWAFGRFRKAHDIVRLNQAHNIFICFGKKNATSLFCFLAKNV